MSDEDPADEAQWHERLEANERRWHPTEYHKDDPAWVSMYAVVGP